MCPLTIPLLRQRNNKKQPAPEPGAGCSSCRSGAADDYIMGTIAHAPLAFTTSPRTQPPST